MLLVIIVFPGHDMGVRLLAARASPNRRALDAFPTLGLMIREDKGLFCMNRKLHGTILPHPFMHLLTSTFSKSALPTVVDGDVPHRRLSGVITSLSSSGVTRRHGID
jgi:hypothetical protein